MEQFVDPIREELESFAVGDIVELFTVDATRIGGAQYLFAPTSVQAPDGSFVAPTFGGNTYMVIPFESQGWDFAAGGTLPQPTIRFMMAREDGDGLTVASYLLSLLSSLDDMLGAKVLRVQTLRKFLDDGEEPNPQAHMGIEVYTIARKSNQTPDFVEFQLQSALDMEDVVLPRRQVLNYCQWAYRRALDNGSFDYADVTCPYVGGSYFNANGEAVADPKLDRCGRRLSDCKLRFGENAELPYGGFPGAGKLRSS
ncbi:phage minor tail protein L [Rhodobacteraceae bacterium G21628-S1]|nr:phage minor tail protein L [Rhodobacteraceae bacterium G21628-S1]